MDPVTQQYYLRARFYNPVVARFTQEDTYRGDGLNLYAYCSNNPICYVDYSGNEKDILGQNTSFDNQGNQHYLGKESANEGNELGSRYDISDGQEQSLSTPRNQPKKPVADTPDAGTPVLDRLVNGSRMRVDDVLDLAIDFLGEGYTEPKPGSGRFVSADQTRAFRMGENDILGRHGGGSHVNFEILAPNPAKPGKMQVVQNIHIYLED